MALSTLAKTARISVVSERNRRKNYSNRVDSLLARIREIQSEIRKIQSNCQHDFRLLKNILRTLRESKVKRVYILFNAEECADETEDSIALLVKCLKCSKVQYIDSVCNKICPVCLGKMQEGECEGAGSRKKYFDHSHLYYSATRYTCSQCGFIGVADTWDR
ncbi:hypothetical protein ACFL3E_02070 [Patescibacteria group bacterium]